MSIRILPAIGRLGLLALGLAALAGCGAPDRSSPAAAAPTHAALPPAPAQPREQIFIHDSMKGGDERLTIIDSASGRTQRDLPPGVVSPDWSTLYMAEAVGGSTRLSALDIASGQPRYTAAIEGDYRLTQITAVGVLGGLSPDGAWLALEATKPPGPRQSRFAVIDTKFQQAPRLVALDGMFAFDALSNNGRSLYLTESLGEDLHGEYQVRRYDLLLGALDPNVVVAKGESEPMNGTRQGAVASRDGTWLYSLYTNPEHGPFIHALNLETPVAACLDLPGSDLATQSRWALALAPGGNTLYAVNGTLGQIAEVNTSDFPAIARTAGLFEPPGRAPEAEPGSGASAVSPDGNTLYALGAPGLLLIDTKTLALRGRFLADLPLSGLALAPDGGRLYASVAHGKLLQVNAQTGAITAEVPAAGQPSGIVRVAAGG